LRSIRSHCSRRCRFQERRAVVSHAKLYPKLFAIVPAAGHGSRMNSDIPKQFLPLHKRQSVLQCTVALLLQLSVIEKLVIAVDRQSATAHRAAMPDSNSRVAICDGGATRAESVLNALEHLKESAPENSLVLVHDAARPCVRVADIQNLISDVGIDSNGGILAMPVNDTIKQVDQASRITATVDRSNLWRAATPQLFPLHGLLTALEQARAKNLEITDEASAMQHAGKNPRVVACASDNIKITSAADLAFAQHILSSA